MPLLFEIKEDDNILCFVPNGHKVGNTFVDLPAQYGPSCWNHAAYRLASMYHTQNGFDITKQPWVVQEITRITAEISDYVHMKYFWDLMFNECVLLGNINPDLIRAKVSKIKTQDELKEKFPSLRSISDKYEFALNRIYTVHAEFFINEFIKVAAVIFTQLILKKELSKNDFKQMIHEHFIMLRNSIMENFLARPEVKNLIREPNIIAYLELSKSLAPEQRTGTYYWTMEFLYNKHLGLKRLHNTSQINPDMWRFIFYKLLDSNGPFLIHGYVGKPFYSNVEPNTCGNFGSLELLHFPKSAAYKLDNLTTAHVVVVIGLLDDKVIYLDPSDPSLVAGPRRAYVTRLDAFMTRVLAFQNKNHKNLLELYVTQADLIDTSAELLLETVLGPNINTDKDPKQSLSSKSKGPKPI